MTRPPRWYDGYRLSPELHERIRVSALELESQREAQEAEIERLTVELEALARRVKSAGKSVN